MKSNSNAQEKLEIELVNLPSELYKKQQMYLGLDVPFTEKVALDLVGMTPIEASYFAGFFDGEGCIRLMESNKSKNKVTKYYLPRVSVASCYYPTLEILANKLDKTIHKVTSRKEHYKDAFCLELSGNKALLFIRAIYPYLQEKKEQAKVFLRFGEYPRRSAQHEKIHKELKQLKRKNYGPKT